MRYSIVDFGAVGDGKTLNTSAIQKAIDNCQRGDTVVIPRGIFVSGAIFLKSYMTLYLEDEATLLGSSDIKDYPICRYRFEGKEQACFASLVNTVDIRDTKSTDAWYLSGHIEDSMYRIKNLTIEGKGTIDANGAILMKKELDSGLGARGRALAIRNTDSFKLYGVTVRQSPAWCVHTIFCKDVVIKEVRICTKYAEDGTKYNVFNGDGFDADSCRDVQVYNCIIETQDDCIAIKSGRDAEGRYVGVPTENVEISNCTFRYGFGVALGSEMSGDVRNVAVRNCTFEDTYSLGSVKTTRGRGGVIENVMFEKIKHYNHSNEYEDCRWFRGAIYVDQFYSYDANEYDPNEFRPVGEGTPLIRNITFKNVETDTVAGNSIFMMGLPERPLENIQLIDVVAKGNNTAIIKNVNNLITRTSIY